MKYISRLEHEGLQWVNVTRQTKKELDELAERFNFLPIDLAESAPSFQRPKIVRRPGYYFIVLHFPVFDRETKRLSFTEIDFFLNANYLVTVHDGTLHPLESFFAACAKEETKKELHFTGTAVHILFELLDTLLQAVFPILLHVNEDISAVDKKLFSRAAERHIAEEILRLKTNIVTFRRAMQGHKTVLERLVMYGDRDLNLYSYQSYINTLREAATEIWHMLDSQKESINALHETNESILSLRMNEVMKTLTVISVITFPLTLVATIFAIRAPATPLVNVPYGFFFISFLTLLGAALMLLAFKKKHWL
ncbi:MAG: magnesium transporter CorA family protein [Candidatus Magasanikbacteria bacterium]|nr:magnesium transporter CorA family protein [Candidatus Magasanikbacteria bacterium]